MGITKTKLSNSTFFVMKFNENIKDVGGKVINKLKFCYRI